MKNKQSIRNESKIIPASSKINESKKGQKNSEDDNDELFQPQKLPKDPEVEFDQQNFQLNLFSNRVVNRWNNLPTDIVLAQRSKLFKL